MNQKLALPRLSFIDPVRMCADCATATRKESEFFDKNLKALTNGEIYFMLHAMLHVYDYVMLLTQRIHYKEEVHHIGYSHKCIV